MRPIRHVLCPTDFSACADQALDAAIAIAQKFDATLTLLHVYTLPVSGFGGDITVLSEQELDVAARKALDGVLDRVRASYPKSEAIVRQGAPAPTILDVADERGADLIVIGTHGRRGVSRVLVGSIAEKVVRTAGVPVLTVSPTAVRAA